MASGIESRTDSSHSCHTPHLDVQTAPYRTVPHHNYTEMGKRLFRSPELSDQLWGPPATYSMRTGDAILGAKCPGRVTDQSPASSAGGQNKWSCNSTPLYDLMESIQTFNLFILN